MASGVSSNELTFDRPEYLPALNLVQSVRYMRTSVRILGTLLIVVPVALLLVPWQQNIAGTGRVMALDPNNRPQPIQAPVSGRVKAWYVLEGSEVEAGQKLLDIEDIDPLRLERLNSQREAIESKIAAAEREVQALELQIDNLKLNRDRSVEIAQLQLSIAEQDLRAAQQELTKAEEAVRFTEPRYQRNLKLEEDGAVSLEELQSSERDFRTAVAGREAAEAQVLAAEQNVSAANKAIEQRRSDLQSKLDKAGADLEKAQGQLADARRSLIGLESDISRQASQVVYAPRDGRVFRLVANQAGAVVTAGETLMQFVPDAQQRAVELWVDGNDTPLIEPGRHVRLQFEGWPAVQFAGWPAVAVGTFGGRVTLVDPTDDGTGRFRLLIVPDERKQSWPAERFLRQGVRTKGWVLLNEVSLGYELWRQLNGFPPVIAQEEPKDDLARKRIK